MALQMDRQTLETEKLIGARRAQTLVRAEALVPGAGRDAIEPLLSDASLTVAQADVQADRVVVEGDVQCQAVYRQGEETAVKAVTAHATLSHVIEIPGAQPGMLCRVRGGVSHVDARYENGHMVFLVSCDLTAQVLSLEEVQVIVGIDGAEGIETVYAPVRSVKLAAEAGESALLRDAVALPAALDARTALMDWIALEVDEVAPDLGGVRVKGRALVETLVSSGVAGRPAVLVRYPLAFSQLVEVPEWLAGDVFCEADALGVKSLVEPQGDDGDMQLTCEAEVRFHLWANATDQADALADAYAVRGNALEVQRGGLSLCAGAKWTRVNEVVRGTVLIGENAPGVGTVIATLARPVVGEWRTENGQGVIEGVIETRVMYVPGGSDAPVAAEAELPFSLTVPQTLNGESLIDIQVLSAEANALMSDRLEMKLQMSVTCETRRRETAQIAREIEEGAPIRRRPGIVVRWPEAGESAWDIGKRYGVAASAVGEIEEGKAVVIRV